jgi:hypothetical protein
MTWDDILEKLDSAGLHPVEEVYIDNYGNMLATHHAAFKGRIFRCTRGIVRCGGEPLEIYLFPSESHLQDFLEVMDADSRWVAHENVLFHFSESDPALARSVLSAVSNGL